LLLSSGRNQFLDGIDVEVLDYFFNLVIFNILGSFTADYVKDQNLIYF